MALLSRGLTIHIRSSTVANRELDSLAQSKSSELDVIARAIDDTNRRLERLYDAVETGKLDLGDLALRIKELRYHQEQLHARKNEIENELADRRVELIDLETMTGYAAEMQEIIREGSLAHRKAFIRGFVKDVRVTGKKAVLIYSPPGLPDKVELNLEGVPRIVQHGGRYWT